MLFTLAPQVSSIDTCCSRWFSSVPYHPSEPQIPGGASISQGGAQMWGQGSPIWHGHLREKHQQTRESKVSIGQKLDCRRVQEPGWTALQSIQADGLLSLGVWVHWVVLGFVNSPLTRDSIKCSTQVHLDRDMQGPWLCFWPRVLFQALTPVQPYIGLDGISLEL